MGLLDIVGGMLGEPQGQGQGGAGLGDLAARLRQGGGGQGGQAALLQMVLGMLVNHGQGGGQGGAGGLGALLQQFQAAGLGEQVNSWVGTGQNLPVSGEQLQGAFGSERMSQMAEKMGLSTGDLGTQLSQMLPQVVDQLTPGGQLPEGGLGDLGSLLGSLMKR